MSSIIVLITGANSGVGFAASKVIASASERYHVIMTGRSPEKLNTAKREIETSPDGIKGSLSTVVLDVTSEQSIHQAFKTVQETHGALDVLINNAGVGSRGPHLQTRMRECLEVNLIGPAIVSEAFRPLLMKSKNPYSIYVSSGAGSIARVLRPASLKAKGPPNAEGYHTSKAGLNMLATLEHVEYGPQGLKVFTMCPGFVVSNLRGTSEEERNGWGGAGDAMVAGKTLLSIVQGERDEDVGKFVVKDGIYPW